MTLQPQVDVFLEKIYQSSLSLFSNPAPASEFAIYEAVDIAVRRKRNSRATINQLAVDIIHCIFAEALDLNRIHDVDFTLESLDAHRKQLFQLRCVSAAWNEFLLASPRYWSAIEIGMGYAGLKKALERAGQTPLCLYSRSPTVRPSYTMAKHKHMTALENVAAQVKSFRAIGKGAARICTGLLSSHMPLLESLELPPGQPWGGGNGPSGMQSLRQLKTLDWLPGVASPRLRDLQTLVLTGWVDIQPGVIQVLAACPNLLALSILSRQNHDSDSDISGNPPFTFTLPRLQELKLQFMDSSQFGLLIRSLITPLKTRGSLHIERLNHFVHPNAKVVDNLYHFISPTVDTPPIFDTATINIYSRKEAPLHRLIRVTYSAGGRSVDFGLPLQWATQGDRLVEDIKAFQTRFNDPPLAIKLINHPKEDTLLPVLANVDVRRIWVTSTEDIGGVLAPIGSSSPTLPSGTPDNTEWPFESVQELTIEDNQLNVKQLTRVVGIRQRYLRANSKSWLKKILLVNCRLIGMPFEKAAKELASLGVVLTETGCAHPRRR